MNIEGEWYGEIETPSQRLEVIFNIHEENGQLEGTMDVPLQGARGLEIDEIGVEGQKVLLHVRDVHGTFIGEMEDQSIDGNWEQQGQSFPLVLKKGEYERRGRPQDPKRPLPYGEEEIILNNDRAGVRLAGTLTMPPGEGPFPAVHLVTGSGDHNRDETIFGHRPFLVLADHLTRNGIAVLRMDDRGVGESTGQRSQATSEELAEDVIIGMDYLRGREEIDADNVGIIGHSGGALVGSIVCSKDPDTAFLVMMAGPGMKGEDLLLEQAKLINEAMGANHRLVEINTEVQERLFEIMKEDGDRAAKKNRLQEVSEEILSGMSEEERLKLEVNEESLQAQIDGMLTPWFEHFLTFDPTEVIEEIECPVLALAGENDLQVAPDKNLQAIREALEAGGNSQYEAIKCPGLNHLFQTSETGLLQEYGQIEETISPQVLQKITDWIANQIDPP